MLHRTPQDVPLTWLKTKGGTDEGVPADWRDQLARAADGRDGESFPGKVLMDAGPVGAKCVSLSDEASPFRSGGT